MVTLLFAILAMPKSEPNTVFPQRTDKPNVLFILTDDQDQASIGRMNNLQDHLVEAGTSFPNAFVTTPVCCPSRATLLRGQYAHNHGVLTNESPRGVQGAERFRKRGADRSTVATWLDGAGYTTAYMGKYLHGYGKKDVTTYLPPGWDRFWGWQGGYNEYGKCCYKTNDNGEIKTYKRARLHDTDYLSKKANNFIRSHRDEAWFLVIAPNPPHSPSYAARRHQDLFQNAEMPRPPSFNEKDVSDKPWWVRDLPRLRKSEVEEAEEQWQQRLRSLQAVDDMVGWLVRALSETDQLDNTYIVYTSDNGYLLYRHRIMAKTAPYEEAIGVPFIVRGPGVRPGMVRHEMVANTDWAPTIADWAGVTPPEFIDGRSIASLFLENPPPWRKRILLELYYKHAFQGVRTSDGKTYVEYKNGARELYDLHTDPYQLNNSYDSAEPVLISRLRDRLDELENCDEAECKVAEN